jgi:endopeptidase La
MTDISLKDYRIHCLQKEYKRYSIFLSDYQGHIEMCFYNGIINISERNNYCKILNNLLTRMNATYNSNMMGIYENEYDSTDNDIDGKQTLSEIFPLANLTSLNSSYEDLRNLVDLYKIIDTDTTINKGKHDYIFKDDFHEIKDGLLDNISCKIGFRSVDNAMRILIGEQYDKLYLNDKGSMESLEFYNHVFIPLSYSIIKIPNNNKLVFLKKVDSNIDILINNCAELYIQKMDLDKSTYLVLKGYFTEDPLNIVIRTSQICHNFIYTKKKSLKKHVSEKKNVPENFAKFAKSYIRNSCIGDIVSLDNKNFYKQMSDEYKKYIELSNMTFMNLMKEFVKDEDTPKKSLFHMFTIIKLFLMGSDDNVNIAGLLFGMTKDKKQGSDYSISDVIFKNLSYICQIELKKTSINIKNQLEKIKSLTVDDIDLKKQVIVCKNMPRNVKKAALEKIEEMKSSGSEYYKQLLYVKTLLNFPWSSDKDDTFFSTIGTDNKKSKEYLENFVVKIDGQVYGHNECKDSIKELIGLWISNPTSSGSAIGLVGPPGVGKTLIAKAIGEALDIPFVQITLGGQNDGEILHGHGYTYSGAQPGMVIKKMVKAGDPRCIMYFDELDKASKKNNDSSEIFSILIHMTDPNTNKEFQDRFFQEISFPLNKVLFIFSYNDSSLVDKILLDRIKEIEVKPFKIQDKIIIAQKFFVKELSDKVGFDNGSIIFKEDDIEFIIDEYTYEPGVRDLKRKMESIFLKLNIDRIYGKNLFKNRKSLTKKNPINISRGLVTKYLGKQNVHIQLIHEYDIVGVINGLYATDVGKGGVLPIQIYNNYASDENKFTLKLTGSQRRVMRESAITAFTAAMHELREDLRNQSVLDSPNGYHIHAPSGSVPKDGPSAGCAFATAFISRILNKKIRHDIAMTGEIELTGKVTKIGGLQYKLTGAKKAGVKLVLVSEENKDDLDTIKKEYPDLFLDGFEVKLVKNLRDVLKEALVDFDPSDLIKK